MLMYNESLVTGMYIYNTVLCYTEASAAGQRHDAGNKVRALGIRLWCESCNCRCNCRALTGGTQVSISMYDSSRIVSAMDRLFVLINKLDLYDKKAVSAVTIQKCLCALRPTVSETSQLEQPVAFPVAQTGSRSAAHNSECFGAADE